MLPAGTVLAGRYTLLDPLGQGGAAVVYRAQDGRLGRVVAVKVLRPQFVGDAEQVARFANEARAAASLTAPHIVDVYDYGQDADSLFIVEQYIDGQDLKHYIGQQGPLAPPEAARIAADVCLGLEVAHERGIIHRDIKPQNILIDRHSQVRITDFGVAKALSAPGLTQAGLTYGTAAYLSPEQATGNPVSPATDIYALGLVLYEMLCGHPPFEAESVVAVTYKQVYEAPPPLQVCAPAVSPPLAAIVMRALAKDPAARYPTAADMAADLQGFLLAGDALPLAAAGPADQPTAAYAAPAAADAAVFQTWSGAQAAHAPPPSRGWLWLAVPAVLLLLVAGAFGSRYLGSNGGSPPPGGGAPTATAILAAAAPSATGDAAIPPTASPASGGLPPAPRPTDTPASSGGLPPGPSNTPVSGGSKGRPVFDTPTPPTGAGRQVVLEDVAFAGGYRYQPPSIYEGRTAVWVYGQGTGFATMSAPFQLVGQPTGTATLLLTGMDSEDAAKTPLRLLVNGQVLYDGPDPLPNDFSPRAGTWGTATWTFPAPLLHPGANTLTIENRSPSSALGIPFIMIDSAQLTWEGER